MQRADLISAFLKKGKWADYKREILAGDASNRRYERLVHSKTNASVVLMDAPKDRGEETAPFVRIAKYLTKCGLRAPEIFQWDEDNGLVVLEDLGDALFARVLEQTPEEEFKLYQGAVDVLIHLHSQNPPKDLESYDPVTMAELGCLAIDWYSDGAGFSVTEAKREAVRHELESVLKQSASGESVLVQRDYHAENLLWIPDEPGLRRVGLLDFQDARVGEPAYDLVSLLEDARRDVTKEVQLQMLDYYCQKRSLDPIQFQATYAAQGAQRNLRILGVFARLSMGYGKPNYIDLIPRVWAHLMADLAHPALQNLAGLVEDLLPSPSSTVLSELKEKCATRPIQ